MGTALNWLVNTVINLVVLVMIIQAVLSWLVVFNIINTSNRVVSQIMAFLDAVTEPILRPFRRIVPRLGGVDISPIVAIITLIFIQILYNNTLGRFLPGLLG
jgi:YggT family protein